MSSPRFLIDTNCFIEPHRTYYPFCYAPAFWDALLRGHEAGMVFSLDEVKNEIVKKEDAVKNWVEQENFPVSFFMATTEATVQKFAEIQNWVGKHQRYSLPEKNKFATIKTDGYLVAHAKENKMILVTHEKLVGQDSTVIQIPNLCQQFDVEYVNLFEMLKQLNVRFVLE